MRKLKGGALLLGTAGLAALGAVALIDGWSAGPLLVHRKPPGAAIFRVGVLGDSQKGLANLRNITEQVMSREIGLLLHTGDLVANNDEGHYRLAAAYLRRGGAPGMPLVAPGNHDVKGGTERFVRWCGPLEQSFVEREIGFVILDDAQGTPPDPQHVEDRIAAAGAHRATVLLMHQPPFDLQGNPKPEFAAFLAWLEKSKVAYLLCGHVHGYIRKKVGDTTVLINGVGGDYDKWQLDQKVYATILEVDGARITDRKIEIEPVHEVRENIEHAAVGHVAEAYRRKPLLCWLGTLLLAGGVGWGWVRFLRAR